MTASLRLQYTSVGNASGMPMPRLPLTLSHENRSINVVGLLDTGATVNILPYGIGVALGASWEAQTTVVPLVGALGHFEARVLFVTASHPQLTPDSPIRLAFAWTQAEDAPVIFGQVNFFMAFDVCFYRTQGVFEVHPRG